MLAANDARITGLRCLDADTGSAGGVILAGAPLEVVVFAEVGASLFATGARYTAGLQVDWVGVGSNAWVDGWLGDATWPRAAAELTLRIPGETTDVLQDRLLGVAGFLRVNAAPPFLVSSMRGPDVFVAPGLAHGVDHGAPAFADSVIHAV